MGEGESLVTILSAQSDTHRILGSTKGIGLCQILILQFYNSSISQDANNMTLLLVGCIIFEEYKH